MSAQPSHAPSGINTQPEPASLRERQRQRTRLDLINAALDVVARVGLDEASVARMTHAAGTSRATLYAHFPEGRTQLLAAAYRQLGHRVLRAAQDDREAASTWDERICASLRAMLRLTAQRELGLFYNVTGPPLKGASTRGDGSTSTLETITHELELGQSRGEVKADIDAASTAALLVGAIREAGIDASLDPTLAPRRLEAFRMLVRSLGTNGGTQA